MSLLFLFQKAFYYSNQWLTTGKGQGWFWISRDLHFPLSLLSTCFKVIFFSSTWFPHTSSEPAFKHLRWSPSKKMPVHMCMCVVWHISYSQTSQYVEQHTVVLENILSKGTRKMNKIKSVVSFYLQRQGIALWVCICHLGKAAFEISDLCVLGCFIYIYCKHFRVIHVVCCTLWEMDS